MKKGFFCKTLVYLTTVILIAILLISLSNTTIAENPPDPPNEGWHVEGNGTYFEITNSSYLNVSLTSSENVQIYMFSIPTFIYYEIDSNCSANSTLITLSGLKINTTYYHYNDSGELISNFTTDETGSYSYTQDLEASHIVFVKEQISTIYIEADGDIVPPGAPISRSGETYTVTANIDEEIRVERSGITLDGNGYNLATWDSQGIWLRYVSGVTVKNFNIYNAGIGIYIMYGSNNVLEYNTFSNNYYGIWLHETDGNTIDSNTVSDSGYYGIILQRYNDYNIVSNNTIITIFKEYSRISFCNCLIFNCYIMTVNKNDLATFIIN